MDKYYYKYLKYKTKYLELSSQQGGDYEKDKEEIRIKIKEILGEEYNFKNDDNIYKDTSLNSFNLMIYNRLNNKEFKNLSKEQKKIIFNNTYYNIYKILAFPTQNFLSLNFDNQKKILEYEFLVYYKFSYLDKTNINNFLLLMPDTQKKLLETYLISYINAILKLKKEYIEKLLNLSVQKVAIILKKFELNHYKIEKLLNDKNISLNKMNNKEIENHILLLQ